MIQVLAEAMVVFILQYVNVSNQYIVHMKFLQCYVSYISIKYFKILWNICQFPEQEPKKEFLVSHS